MTIKRLEISNPHYSAPKTQVITIHSSFLNRRQDVTIYNSSPKKKNLPVIILLHGVYGNHWVWMQLGGVHLVYEDMRKAGLNEFVLVMPSDGGIWDGSAYLPLEQHGDFERWITDDVIDAVTQTQTAVDTESRWYIGGLSMGGYGALRLGAKYAERFCGISAHSAITQLDDMALFVDQSLENYHCRLPYEADIIYWCKQNRQQLPPLRFDCGRDDKLIQSNQTFAASLVKSNIPHTFDELSGRHEWSYWHKNIQRTLNFFTQIESTKK